MNLMTVFLQAPAAAPGGGSMMWIHSSLPPADLMAFLPDQTAACKCKHCCIVHPTLLPAQTR